LSNLSADPPNASEENVSVQGLNLWEATSLRSPDPRAQLVGWSVEQLGDTEWCAGRPKEVSVRTDRCTKRRTYSLEQRQQEIQDA